MSLTILKQCVGAPLYILRLKAGRRLAALPGCVLANAFSKL